MCECLYVYYMCVCCPQRVQKRETDSPGTGDTGGCATWVLETNPESTTETAVS